ncbi:MAG: LysR substrate-binding domain-containing protein [Lautropia sp.]
MDDRKSGGPSLCTAELTLLAEIADAGSLTLAARTLGSTQPALSKQLRRLEEFLGVPLFERGVRGVSPTEFGAALLPRARTVREQIRQAQEDVAQLRGRREGRVSIALAHFATIALLPQVMRSFREAWPLVTIRITPPSFQLAGLREGDPDFAVMSLPAGLPESDYTTRPVYATTVVAVVREGHPLAKARALEQLVEADWILPSLESAIARGVKRAFAKAQLPGPRCPITCETLTGLETLIASSDLIGAMPLEVYLQRRAASRLLMVPLDLAIEGPRVVILRWAEARPTPASMALEQAFVKAAATLAKSR